MRREVQQFSVRVSVHTRDREADRSVPDATHIFDGLSAFPTHVAHMRFGSFVTNPTPWPLLPVEGTAAGPDSQSLYAVALQWLRDDRKVRTELEKAGRKVRGARRDQVCTHFIRVVHRTALVD